jgi:hypothetical protein
MATINEFVEETGIDIDRKQSKKKKKSRSWFECGQLLVGLLVPIAIAVYTVIQYNNDQAIAQENRRQDLEIANQTRFNDLEIAAAIAK